MHADPPLRILATIAPATALLDVGALEHQQRRVAAELHRGGQRPSGGLREQDLADRGGAGEGQGRRPAGRPRTASDTGPGSEVVITLTTPSGAPARRRTSATHSAVSGVSAAGLSIAVQPAASAGASLRVAIAAGKFQGVIM